MSSITNYCDEIIQELTNYRIGLTKIIHDVRILESKINKEIKY